MTLRRPLERSLEMSARIDTTGPLVRGARPE